MKLEISSDDHVLSRYILEYNEKFSSIYKHVYVCHAINHDNDQMMEMITELKNVKNIAYFEYKFIEGILMEELIKRIG